MEYYINFSNKTDIIVQISSNYIINGETSIMCKIVDINETINMHSLNGEWFIDTYITDINILEQYTKSGKDFGYNIGKIQQKHPIDTKYHAFLKNNNFKLIHEIDNITLYKSD